MLKDVLWAGWCSQGYLHPCWTLKCRGDMGGSAVFSGLFSEGCDLLVKEQMIFK